MASAVMFLVASVLVLRTGRLLKVGSTVFGSLSVHDPDGAPLAEPRRLVEFPLLSGGTAWLRRPRLIAGRARREPNRFPVVYDPGHPKNARVMAFGDLWLQPLVVGGLGVVAALLGLIALYS